MKAPVYINFIFTLRLSLATLYIFRCEHYLESGIIYGTLVVIMQALLQITSDMDHS